MGMLGGGLQNHQPIKGSGDPKSNERCSIPQASWKAYRDIFHLLPRKPTQTGKYFLHTIFNLIVQVELLNEPAQVGDETQASEHQRREKALSRRKFHETSLLGRKPVIKEISNCIVKEDNTGQTQWCIM